MAETPISGRTSGDLLAVTMGPQAAEHALKALTLAVGRLVADLPEQPRDSRDIRAWEAEQWLNWLGGRIRLAQRQAEESASG